MYAKLYSRLTESSIIEEPVMTRWVFVGMLAIAEVDGTVIGTDVAIARRLNITVEELHGALKTLMSPDASSNNMDYEGRRVIESPNERGYFLTSYEKYRTLQTKEMRREYMKEYMANKRLNQKDDLLTSPKLTESLQSLPVNSVRHAEGEGEGEADPLRGFHRFWEKYPKCTQKLVCQKLWRLNVKDRTTEDRLFSVLDVQMKSNDWTKDGGKYAPSSKTYLEGACWEDKNKTNGSDHKIPSSSDFEKAL